VSALGGISFWVVQRSAFPEDKSPNEKINLGFVGCGGMGWSNLKDFQHENIVALCDVDDNRAANAYKLKPQAKRYHDFREMLEKEKTIDAVVVATPDHVHAPASIMAMKLGKHCFCQKPLTHSVYEARMMRTVAAEYKVATQMGNQGTAENGLRRAVEVIRAGALGPVREVHVWTNRPIWPQGMDRPAGSTPVPDYLKWDLWLGPAPERPFYTEKDKDTYCPFTWRGWLDFGTGALGDMACHTANMPFMALKLEAPTAIEAKCSGMNNESYPKWSEIRFEFPARGELCPVNFFWYDGGKRPPKEITADLDRVPISGCIVVGDKGKLFSPDDYGARFRLFPEESFKDYKGPDETLPRSPGHYKEWLDAIRGGRPAMSNFEYAARLTEMILLGNLALRAGKKLEWDTASLKITNWPEAAQYIRREYRKGYTL